MRIFAESLLSPGHKLSCQHSTRHQYFAEAGERCGWRSDGERIHVARLQLRKKSRGCTKNRHPTRWECDGFNLNEKMEQHILPRPIDELQVFPYIRVKGGALI